MADAYMSAASDITAVRIVALNEEGFRDTVYDDATGRILTSFIGTPTIGYGCVCKGWSKELALAVLKFQLEQQFEPALLGQTWYVACDDYRRSALLEIAFNQGDYGLMRKNPNLVAAVTRQDWASAQTWCNVEDPRLKARYETIGKVLLLGAAV